MRIKIILLLVVFLGLTFCIQSNVHARKRLFSGTADGMASVEMSADSLEDVTAAVKSVFAEDEYEFRTEWEGRLTFARSAGRMKDFAYSSMGGVEGMWEQVVIDIHTLSSGKYRVECNVTMTKGDKFSGMHDTKVLKLFGREYKKILKRVRKKLKRMT